MSLIDFLICFLFWLLTNLLCYRLGRWEGKRLRRMNGRGGIFILMLAFATGCGSAKPALMTYLGDVILINDCEVCVSYGNVGESDNSKTLGCFAHYEGHRYQVGDKYPQVSKHTTGTIVVCGDTDQGNTKSN